MNPTNNKATSSVSMKVNYEGKNVDAQCRRNRQHYFCQVPMQKGSPKPQSVTVEAVRDGEKGEPVTSEVFPTHKN